MFIPEKFILEGKSPAPLYSITRPPHQKKRRFMLFNKIILVPYQKSPEGPNTRSMVEWFIQVDDSSKINFEIGPFRTELLAADFMTGTETRYQDFLEKLIEFMMYED